MKEKFLKFLNYAGEYSLYALIIFIPISNAAIESFFGFMFLFFILKKIIKPDFVFLKSYSNIFLLFFVLFMGTSLFNSGHYLTKSLSALFLKWLEYILIFVITVETLRDKKRVTKCLWILLFTACLIGIDVLFQKFTGADFIHNKKMVSLVDGSALLGVTASFHHYNSLGTYLVFVLSLVLALLISIKNKLQKTFLFALLILLQVCLILTFSRGSWIGFLVALISMLFLSPKVSKLVYVFSIFITIIVFLPGIRERAMFIFAPQGDADRFLVWHGAFRMIKAHPFLGMGLGTFMANFQEYVSKAMTIQYAHNCYLQIWAESGIFALLSFILFIGSVFYKSIKTFKKNNSNFVSLGFICAFFGFLVQSFFDNQLYSLQLSSLFWFMIGVIVALTKQEEDTLSLPIP